ncbi:MFS general substrate transporter [Mycena galericulata]|nr:MFS general substrate transporter [Mycena galericulata]
MSLPHKHYDRAMTKKILWKLDLHILPFLALLWLCNFIDRSNVGNARIAGLEKDTGLVGNQFNIVLTVFYVTYLLIEVPSNLVMKKVGPNRWIPFLVALWGAITTLTALVNNFGGLIAIRLFLGLCEGGLLPGIILYLSTIYKPHELQLRVGIFYASASLSGAFGGLLATAILSMDGIGNLAGWKWIFVLEGLATVLSGLLAAFFLPESIAKAKFLSEEEKEFALGRFHQDEAITSTTLAAPPGPQLETEKADVYTTEETESATPEAKPVRLMDEQFEWREVIRGLTDFQAWVTGIAYLGLIVSLYSFSLFLPTIVAGLGFSGKSAQLHTVPPYVPATVLTAVLSDRLKWRAPFILICLPFAIAGYILAIAATNNAQRYGAVFLIAAGVYPSAPAILSILPNNGSGYYKRATTTGLQLCVANAGGFIATNIYTTDQAPTYKRGHSIVLGFLLLAWALTAVNVWYCMRENRARAEGRRQANIAAYEELWSTGKTRAPIGDRHPDFRFTL